MGMAALIIDMQEAYLSNTLNRESIVDNQVHVLEFCKMYEIPVILIEYNVAFGSVDRILDAWESLTIKDQITKDDEDAFYETRLNKTLQNMGADELIMMGVGGGSCLYKAAKSAIDTGYKVYASKDLTNSMWFVEEWYEKNTELFDNYTSLINTISEKHNLHFNYLDRYVSVLSGIIRF